MKLQILLHLCLWTCIQGYWIRFHQEVVLKPDTSLATTTTTPSTTASLTGEGKYQLMAVSTLVQLT